MLIQKPAVQAFFMRFARIIKATQPTVFQSLGDSAAALSRLAPAQIPRPTAKHYGLQHYADNEKTTSIIRICIKIILA